MKTLAQYMSQPYPIEIIPDEGGYIAMIPDLPGCMSSGASVTDALEGLEEAKELWIEGKLDQNEVIPEPTAVEDYSGKFVLRIPRSLHHSLDHEARRQGVSLNQYILHVLSERHHLSVVQKSLETVLDKLAACPPTPLVQHRDWPWEQHHFRAAINFIMLSQVEDDILENLPYVPKPPSGSMVFTLGDLTSKTRGTELARHFKMEGPK